MIYFFPQQSLSPDQQNSSECKDAIIGLQLLRSKVKGTSFFCLGNIMKFFSDPELGQSHKNFLKVSSDENEFQYTKHQFHILKKLINK